ncbi:collagen triple helix repeat protein [Synechococcus phage S-CAM7]|uniref:Collagen triple helix repeat protein n=1 Tax=Synechococcus phage S-CAM7 TaxID=1883368 RepID=A0A1D8KUV5_9CAUD|nr:collagen triple helix repeat protein [Synechococcus phage S-CAM7]AOV62163.1 collagen triple helix repeat protein [Synechococcus phage S-CAM7]AOV62429.1 collagen triple helix repeat protein [Synechococcus phage S-CAM7]
MGDVTYKWDGSKWISTSVAPVNIGATGPSGPAGPTGATGSTVVDGSDISAGVVTATEFDGNLSGNVAGDTTGIHNGDVYARDGSKIILETAINNGDTAHYTGTVTGDVTGDTTGTHYGTNTGQQHGDVYTNDGGQQVIDTAAIPSPLFKGDAEGLDGDPNIQVTNLTVVGLTNVGVVTAAEITTDDLNADSVIAGFVTSVNSYTSGIATAGKFYGDGSNLTGIATQSGATGATGPQGSQGATGIPGPFGPYGITGATGATGVDGPVGSTGATGDPGLAAMCFTYRYDSDTDTNDEPLSGRISFNNSNPENATVIAINDTNGDAVDISNFFGLFGAGSKVYIQEERDASSFILLTLNAGASDQGGWYKFTNFTVNISGNVTFTNLNKLMVCVQPQGPAGPTGATGLTGAGTSATSFQWNDHIIPDSTESYDIGSAEYKVRHLFLSDNSVYTDSGEVRVGFSTQVGTSTKMLKGTKLQEIVANSVDFADFKVKMASEDFGSL